MEREIEREREGERKRFFEKDIYNNTKSIIVLNSRYIEIYLKLLDHTIYICFHSKNMGGYGTGDILFANHFISI